MEKQEGESGMALTGFQGLGVIGSTTAVRSDNFCSNQSQNILCNCVGNNFAIIIKDFLSCFITENLFLRAICNMCLHDN